MSLIAHRRVQTPTVRTVLLIAMLLPIAVVAILGVKYTIDATERADHAAEVVSTAEIVGDRVRLRAAVGSEQRWTSVLDKLGALAIAPDLVSSAIGLDPWAEADRAAREADELIARMSATDLGEDLRLAREVADDEFSGPERVTERYGAIVDRLNALIESDLGLVAGAASVERAGALADAAARLQHARGEQMSGWMGVAAGVVGGADDPALLLVEATVRAEVLADEVEQTLSEGSRVASVLTDAEALAALASLREIYQVTTTALIAGEIEGVDSGEIDLVALFAHLDEFIEVANLTAVSEPYLLRIVDAAVLDLSDAAADQQSSAVASRTWMLLLVLGSVVGMAALLVVLTGLIIRPMAQVADVAAAMQDGSLDRRATVAGLRETQLAARALNGAVAQVKLAERQALALAEERLDDEVLDESVSGLLGSSLRRSVAQLRERIVEREGWQRRLEHDAAHDSLTLLPNRGATLKHLDRSLARARRGEHQIAVIFVDIDFFKDVNDRYGHDTGDELLRVMASRLDQAAREGDLVGRLGGDEFLMIAEPVARAEDAVLIADRVLAQLCVPIELDDLVLHPSASIGVAVSSKTLQLSDDLVNAADLALYRAKEGGRNRVEVCDDELRATLAARVEVNELLAGAIDRGQLLLHYQPVVDAATKRLVGAEALVRWERPGVGLVMPDAFIPFAERGDLIVRLDRWVLRAAARQLAVWSQSESTRHLDLAVNVSGRHLSSQTFVSDVLDPLRELGVAPQGMILEITESALVTDLEQAALRLGQVKQAGVRVALDDFGTGFASLAHLRSLPIDILKIDRTFVNELEGSAVHPFVSLVVDTGRLLDVRVVGEGVETAAQAESLVAHGCDLLQGYLYGRPGPVEVFEAMAAEAESLGAF